VSGRIVDGQTWQPLTDVRYGYTRFINPTQYSSVNNGAVTNSRGEFKIEKLIPGEYSVSLTPQADIDRRAEEVRFEIVDRDVTGLVIKTVKGASLSGVVVLDGIADKAVMEKLRDATLVVFVATERTRNSGVSGVQAPLRPDGKFRFGGLPTGIATFALASAQGFRIIRVERDGVIQPAGVELKQGEDITTMRIVLAYGDASIRGIVEVDNGTIPPNGRIFLRVRKINDNSLSTSASFVPAQIDARGQFVLDNLLPGTYELTAGVFVPGARAPFAEMKQEVVATAGSPTNTTIKLNLNPPQSKP
jgi:hypothetical protein